MRRCKFHLIFIALLVLILNTYGLDFSIQPIRLAIYQGKITTVFEIKNHADKKIAIETEIRKWDQDENGEYIYYPTEEMVVVPPYIELEPKQKQLVRIAYLGDFSKPVDLYRLYLRQVPIITKPSKELEGIRTSVQILLNLSVPVYVIRDKDAKYNLSIQPLSKSKEKVTLHIENTGSGVAKIRRIILFKNNEVIHEGRFIKFILPGKKVNLDIAIKKLGKNGQYYFEEFPDVPDKIILVLDEGDAEKEITVNL